MATKPLLRLTEVPGYGLLLRRSEITGLNASLASALSEHVPSILPQHEGDLLSYTDGVTRALTLAQSMAKRSEARPYTPHR